MIVLYENRFKIIIILILLLFLILIGRILFISNHYKFLLEDNSSYNYKVERGKIFDRNGNIIASNYIKYSVFIDPSIINKVDKYSKIFSYVLKLPEKDIYNKIKKNKRRKFLFIKRFISEVEKQNLEKYNLKGVFFQKEYKRVYPLSEILSPIVGYVNSFNEGLDGIEYQFNKILFPRENYNNEDKTNNIYLTIDNFIQYIAYDVLKKSYIEERPDWAAVVIQNAKNSEILAIAKFPTFDPYKYQDYNYFIKKNRVVTDIFEPGSTFKVFITSVLFDTNKINFKDYVYCSGIYYVTKKTKIHDLKAHGWQNISGILKHSCNVGIIELAERLDKLTLYKYLLKFGFGTKTGIEIPGETEGILKKVNKWTKMTKAIINIGQEIGVNMIQMITGFSSVINGGKYYLPHIIKKIDYYYGKDKIIDHPLIRQVISDHTSAIVKNLLINAVSAGGTGEEAYVKDVVVGGKTGTAQIPSPDGGYYKNKSFTSFIGFMDYKGRLLSIYIVFYNPKKHKFGGNTAAPVFRKIVKRLKIYFDIIDDKKKIKFNINYNNLFSRAEERIKKSNGKLPDLKGLTLKEVLYIVKKLNIKIKVKGSGFVVYQSYSAGTDLKKIDILNIILNEELEKNLENNINSTKNNNNQMNK